MYDTKYNIGMCNGYITMNYLHIRLVSVINPRYEPLKFY